MNVRVLIVDNHRTILDGMRMLLTFSGMEVVEATDCDAARRAIEQFEFDAVILDLRLPDGDGCDVLMHIRVARPGLPVLIYSSSSRPRQLAKCYALGANGYLPKGVGHGEILEAIRNVLDGGSAWTHAQLATIRRQNLAAPTDFR